MDAGANHAEARLPRDDRGPGGSNALEGGLNPSLEAAFAAVDGAQREISDLVTRQTGGLASGEAAALVDIVDTVTDVLDQQIETLRALRVAITGPLLDQLSQEGPTAHAVAATIVALMDKLETADRGARRLATALCDHRAELADLITPPDADPILPPDDEPMPERPVFDRAIATAVRCAIETDRRLAVLIVGVDRFAEIEASDGTVATEAALTAVGRTLVAGVADLGVVYRYSADMFAVILPDSNLRQAVAVGEHLRRGIAHQGDVPELGRDGERLSISVGASALSHEDDVASLMERVSCCLGEAQWAGGDRVMCETDPDFDIDLRRRG